MGCRETRSAEAGDTERLRYDVAGNATSSHAERPPLATAQSVDVSIVDSAPPHTIVLYAETIEDLLNWT